jgi:hypothetical protein
LREPIPEPNHTTEPNSNAVHTAANTNTDTGYTHTDTTAHYTDTDSSRRDPDADSSDDSEPDPRDQSSGAAG